MDTSTVMAGEIQNRKWRERVNELNFTEENLLAFTTAARFGSFSKAAEELGLTTSAISYTIKRMETGLDVVLFTRSTRSIELTESGRYFFPQSYRPAE